MENKPVKQASGGNTIKKIAIDVVTPVLAATIIYFLGFNTNDDGKAAFKRKKAATEKAWTLFVENKGIFSAVMKELGGSTDIELTRSNINHEIDVTVTNLESIKKDGDADQRVYSSVELTAQQIKDVKPLLNKFLDDMTAFAAGNPTEEQGMAYIKNLGEDLKEKMILLKARDSLRLNTFYKGLNKDYGVTLPVNAAVQGGK